MRALAIERPAGRGEADDQFGFEDYRIERPSQVLSLQDKIRLEIKLVARQT